MEANVVSSPANTEILAARRQLADEIGEGPVVGVAAGLGAQERHDIVGDGLPVREEVRGPRIEEDETSGVGRSARVREQFGEEGASELICIQDVQPPVLHEGRNPGHRIEDPLHIRAYALLGRTSSSRPRCVRGPRQIDQVGPFGLVQP